MIYRLTIGAASHVADRWLISAANIGEAIKKAEKKKRKIAAYRHRRISHIEEVGQIER